MDPLDDVELVDEVLGRDGAMCLVSTAQDCLFMATTIARRADVAIDRRDPAAFTSSCEACAAARS